MFILIFFSYSLNHLFILLSQNIDLIFYFTKYLLKKVLLMLGDKDLLHLNPSERPSFVNEIQESKFNQILEEKQKEIKALKKTIKKLTKELKQKNQSIGSPTITESANSPFKILLEKEFNKNNQLKQLLKSVVERIRKIISEVNQEFSLSQNSESMQNLVKMLQNANFSGQGSIKVTDSLGNSQQEANNSQDQQSSIDHAMDQFQIIMKGFSLKHNETKKMYKQSLHNMKQIQQELSSYKKQLKNQKKSKDLLQKLLQKNQTQKNQLLNQINAISNQNDINQLKTKQKQDILNYCFKLNYRIKDLQKEKQDYLKSSTRQREKQIKLYEGLLNEVKGIKQRSRVRQSVA